jgi:hypothetical protein
MARITTPPLTTTAPATTMIETDPAEAATETETTSVIAAAIGKEEKAETEIATLTEEAEIEIVEEMTTRRSPAGEMMTTNLWRTVIAKREGTNTPHLLNESSDK